MEKKMVLMEKKLKFLLLAILLKKVEQRKKL